jgi:hypothetical protein
LSLQTFETDRISVTQEVHDYVLDYRQGNILYEIHLIDSPGFDDGSYNDTEILSRIAAYVNTTYKLKQTLAGVIYLHDITKHKMGGVGLRNLRMLENLIGIDKWDNCTLVTTKWGCTKNPQGEEEREKTLRNEDKYFGAMLKSAHQATMMRFDPRSKGRALEIIKPHLKKRFAPQISVQMVDEDGPKMALGDTDAGKIVADNVERLLKATGQIKELEASQKILRQKFDEKLFNDFKERRNKLTRKQQLRRAGRWAIRTTIVGGSIAATVVTLGPGASAFVLEPAFEKIASRQKREERAAMDSLERDLKEQSAGTRGLEGYDTSWLRDKSVQRMQDLDSYSLKNRTSMELVKLDECEESEGSEGSEESEEFEALKNRLEFRREGKRLT